MKSTLVNEIAIDVEQRLTFTARDHVLFPDLVEQGAGCSHGAP
jgi:hypothetical protein